MNDGDNGEARGAARRGVAAAVLLGVVIAGAVGAAGYMLGRHSVEASTKDDDHSAEEDDSSVEPVAAVKTLRLVAGDMSQRRGAYGSVTAQPGETNVLSVAFESRVVRALVVAGQSVGADTPVVRIEPSPDARLAVAEAERTVAATALDLGRVKEQFDARLATNQELSSAAQAAELAKLRAASLRERGSADGPRELVAGVAGIVARVAVQQGQLTPAGGALVEVVPDDALVAKLWLDPGDAVVVGQTVALSASLGEGDGKAVEGRVTLVAKKLTADARRVEVFVALPKDHPFVLDAPLNATWTAPPLHGMRVPRLAVLPSDEGQTIFVVTDGHAHRRLVKILAGEGDELLVAGDEVKEGDDVVIVGNLELEDAMAVSVGVSPATAAAAPPSQDGSRVASQGDPPGAPR